MRVKLKLQEAGDDEEVGNDNMIALDREVVRGCRAPSTERKRVVGCEVVEAARGFLQPTSSEQGKLLFEADGKRQW